jgi:hypothetical protein
LMRGGVFDLLMRNCSTACDNQCLDQTASFSMSPTPEYGNFDKSEFQQSSTAEISATANGLCGFIEAEEQIELCKDKMASPTIRIKLRAHPRNYVECPSFVGSPLKIARAAIHMRRPQFSYTNSGHGPLVQPGLHISA